jgi:hypothetical protein
MELIILGGIVVVVLFFTVSLRLFFPQGPWDRKAQNMARSMWLGIVAVGGAISVVWFGLPALVTIWPFWLLFAGASGLFFAVGEWRARKHEAPRQTLQERRAELVQQGKSTAWVDPILAQQPQAQPKGGGLFDWLDRL